MGLATTVLWRSLRLRCPRCGVGRIFPGVLRTAPACESCGLATLPEPGYFVGAIYINYGATALLGLLLVLLVFRDLPANALVAGAAAWCLLFPTWFFRYSRSLWHGLNHYRSIREGPPPPAPRRGPPEGTSMNCALLCLLLLRPAAASEGTLVVLNKSDDTASLVEVSSGKVLATLPTGDGPHEVVATRDGRRAFVSNYGGGQAPGNSVTVLDLAERKVAGTWTFEKWSRPHGLALSGDEALLYVTSEGSASLEVVDPRTEKVVASLPTSAQGSHMVAIASGRAFVANIGSGSVSVFDLEERQWLANVPTGRGAEGITATPDGTEVWVGNRAADTLTVLDAATLRAKGTLPAASFPIRIAMTPDGTLALVSLAQSGEVALYSVKERKEVGRIAMPAAGSGGEGRVFGGQFGASPVPVGLLVTPDGKEAIVACTQSDVVFAI
ncbi:MAG TPA: beta-propeller fold lactonase family protein, partial [Planctomycetota bacterium]|nr:beta-propeller fold lactonase family protein [Planctomycetota bacterium]